MLLVFLVAPSCATTMFVNTKALANRPNPANLPLKRKDLLRSRALVNAAQAVVHPARHAPQELQAPDLADVVAELVVLAKELHK
jgi:hypothetical protein